MGIDAEMAVTLKNANDIDLLNARFKVAHDCEDTAVPSNGDLIFRDQLNEGFPTNTFAVNVGWMRYYGKHYERGPILKFITQIEWLRAQPEVLEVYYGGDCDVGLNPISREESVELLFHFFKYGEQPYRGDRSNTWVKP
jgi:hypothetical protein